VRMRLRGARTPDKGEVGSSSLLEAHHPSAIGKLFSIERRLPKVDTFDDL